MSGNSHQKRVFERALTRLLERRMSTTNPVQDKWAKIYFFIGLFVALVLPGLALIGITVNVWLGGAILAVAFVCLIRAFYIWEGSLKLHVYLRIGTVALAGLLYFGIIGRQMIRQYKIDQGDLAFVHEMSKPQITEATGKLAKEMVDFETKHRADHEATESEWSLKMRMEPDPRKVIQLAEQMHLALDASYAKFLADYRKDYRGKAIAVRNELLFRLRLTPEQADRRVTESLPPSPFSRHLAMALDGMLSGPSPIADAALYLETLAGLVQ